MGMFAKKQSSILYFGPNMNTNIFGMFFLARIRIQIYSESYFGPNTNMNIFVILLWTKYEYSNIFGSNIRTFLARIFGYFLLEYLNTSWNRQVIKFEFPEYKDHNYAITFVKVTLLSSLALFNPASIQLVGLSQHLFQFLPPHPHPTPHPQGQYCRVNIRFVEPSMTDDQ